MRINNDNRNSFLVYICLFAIMLFHLANNIVWHKVDTSLPVSDAGFHIGTCYKMYHTIKDPQSTLWDIAKVDIYYPPLLYLSASGFMFMFGTDMDLILISLSLFFLILIASAYLLGAQCSGAWGGLLAAFVTSMVPRLYGYSRQSLTEIPYTAFTLLAIYFLYKSDGFSSRRYSILAGFAIGLAMLSKWSCIFFLWFPVAYSLYLAITRRHPRLPSKANLLQALFATLLFGVLSYFIYISYPSYLLIYIVAGWALFGFFALLGSGSIINSLSSLLIGFNLTSFFYLPNLAELVRINLFAFTLPSWVAGMEVHWYHPRSLTYYSRVIMHPSFSYFLGALVLVSLGLFILRRLGYIAIKCPVSITTRYWWTVLGAIIGSYPLLTLANNKSFRYFVPVFPVIVTWLCYQVLCSLRPKHKRVFIPIMILFLLVQFYAYSWGIPDSRYSVFNVARNIIFKPDYGMWGVHPPSRGEQHTLPSFIDELIERSEDYSGEVSLCSMCDSYEYNPGTISMYLFKFNADIFHIVLSGHYHKPIYQALLEDCTFIVTLDRLPRNRLADTDWSKAWRFISDDPLRQFARDFQVVKRFGSQEGFGVILFQYGLSLPYLIDLGEYSPLEGNLASNMGEPASYEGRDYRRILTNSSIYIPPLPLPVGCIELKTLSFIDHAQQHKLIMQLSGDGSDLSITKEVTLIPGSHIYKIKLQAPIRLSDIELKAPINREIYLDWVGLYP